MELKDHRHHHGLVCSHRQRAFSFHLAMLQGPRTDPDAVDRKWPLRRIFQLKTLASSQQELRGHQRRV